MTDTIDLLLDAVQVAYDEEAPNEALRSPFIEHVEKIRAEERFKCKTAIQLQLDSNEEARKDERAKVLSEVEGWLVDEVVTQRYSGGVYINDVLYSSGTTLDIEKLKKEVEVKNRLRAVLRAKLNQLKEEG